MYMAPEVLAGHPYGINSDLYSLGVNFGIIQINLYEMLFGFVPYDAQNIEELLEQIHSRGPLFSNKSISKKVESLIRSLLEPNSSKRLAHSALFDLVTRDPHYPASLLETPEPRLDRLPSQDKGSHALAESVVDKFLKEVLQDRAKYEHLVKLAQKASHYRQ